MARPSRLRSRRTSAFRPAIESLEQRALLTGYAMAFEAVTAANGTSALDAAGNFYISGSFRDTFDFDLGPVARTLSSAGEDDAFVAKFAPDGTLQWARRIGSPGADAASNGYCWTSVGIAPDGTVGFATGFTGTADITGINGDGTSYSAAGTNTAVGTLDTLVGTFDSDGNVLWTRALGGSGSSVMNRPIGVGPDGSILLAGSFTGTFDLDRTATYGDNRDILTSAGDEDIFVARLTSSGSFAWANRVGGLDYESGIVAVDSVGNAYLSGAFQSTSITVGTETLTNRTVFFIEGFISKLDAATGDFLWTRQIGGAGVDVSYAGNAAYHDPNEADPDQGNSVYISGELRSGSGPVNFGDSNLTLTRTAGKDGYIARLDGDGNFLWAKPLQGSLDKAMRLMATDAAGNVYANVRLTGTGTTDMDPGPGQALVAMRPGATLDSHLLKLDADGNFQWDRAEGRYILHAVAADGSVHAFGTYNDATTEFDTGSGSVTLPAPASGTNAFYLLKIDQDSLGAVFGRAVYPSGYPAEGAAVTLKQNGNVIASATTGEQGEFTFRYLAPGTYTMDTLGGTRTFTLTEAGQFLSDQNIVPPPAVEATKFFVIDDGSSNRTYQYGATGSANANTALASGNSAPRGAASNAAGTRVWVVDANKTVYVYNASGGLLGSWSASGIPKGAAVEGITTNGTDIWIFTNSSSWDRVYKYTGAASRLSGSQKAASNFTLSNFNPKGIVTDGTSFWIVDDGGTDYVHKYTLTGSWLGNWTIDPANGSPTGITINPNNVGDIWIVDNAALKVFQYSDASSITSGNRLADRTFTLAPGNTNPQDIADPPSPDQLLVAASSVSGIDAAVWGGRIDPAPSLGSAAGTPVPTNMLGEPTSAQAAPTGTPVPITAAPSEATVWSAEVPSAGAVAGAHEHYEDAALAILAELFTFAENRDAIL